MYIGTDQGYFERRLLRMTEWKKSGEYKSVLDIITKKNGLTLKDVMDPKPVQPEDIESLTAAAGCIFAAIDCETPIYIVGDYDADGVTSTAILTMTLRAFGGNVQTIIPRRMTDGYGISHDLIKSIRDSFIITVDNGIAANEVIKAAKEEQGNTVVVIDHHLPQGDVPCADVVIDPHVHPENNGFTEYCGAGLAYKLACYMTAGMDECPSGLRMDDLTVLACIGTIADVMPMIGDNRRIIREGLKILNDEARFLMLSPGIRHLMLLAQKPYTEETVKYQIGPVMNACGRLYDRGSESVLKELLNQDETTAAQYALKMKEINEERKLIVSNCLESLTPLCEKHKDEPIITLFEPGIPEGVVGILTGKIAEQYKRPAFVFTTAKYDDTICKGSGRSYGGFDISPMVEAVLPLCVAGGGHAGAAGLTVERSNWQQLADSMLQYMKENGPKNVDMTLYYDMQITTEDVEQVSHDQSLFAPYGEAIERPVFLVEGFRPVQNKYGNTHMLMGGKSEHIKFFGNGISAVGFGFADRYITMNYPDAIDLLCTVDANTYKGVTTPQLSIIDLRPAKGAKFLELFVKGG